MITITNSFMLKTLTLELKNLSLTQANGSQEIM